MGGKFTLIIGLLTAILFYLLDNGVFLWLTIGTTILFFWSYGVMHNFAMESAKIREERMIRIKQNQGVPASEIDRIRRQILNVEGSDLKAVPNWLTLVNLLFAISAYILFLISLIMIFLI